MLIRERMEETRFSSAEKLLVEDICNHSEELQSLTVQQIAKRNFVHPSTLIRVAKKLGYHGWLELKEDFLAEERYLTKHFQKIDANLPFLPTDGITTIAQKLTALEHSTLDDTLSLIHHDELNRAKQLLLAAQPIKVFGSNANRLISQDFLLKMNRIGKSASQATPGEDAYEALNLPSNSCAILISYTGENHNLRQIAQILKEQAVPFIAITSIGDNEIARLATCSLKMTTRERLYSKIGNFSINTSVTYLLNLLYCCVFSENYQQNLDHLIQTGALIDKRPSTVAVMAESPTTKSIQLQDSFLPN